MADPFAAENDAEWSQWFAALRDGQKAEVIEAVTCESNEFILQNIKGREDIRLYKGI